MAKARNNQKLVLDMSTYVARNQDQFKGKNAHEFGALLEKKFPQAVIYPELVNKIADANEISLVRGTISGKAGGDRVRSIVVVLLRLIDSFEKKLGESFISEEDKSVLCSIKQFTPGGHIPAKD